VATLIQFIGFLVAVSFGIPIRMYSTHAADATLVYIGGIALGALTSHLSAWVRQSQSVREMRQWARGESLGGYELRPMRPCYSCSNSAQHEHRYRWAAKLCGVVRRASRRSND
jgi:hypothetical protein